MDDIVNSVPSWMFTAIIAVCILFIIGIIFARLYRRASAEQAFVRTGLGGQKVVMSGGAIVMPIFHEIIPINMNTLKLEVSRSTIDSLITKDRMRVDVVVAFWICPYISRHLLSLNPLQARCRRYSRGER